MDVAQYLVTRKAVCDERPVGVWADAPAVGASGDVLTNTSGYLVELNVTGGTVTAAKRNGVTITGISATGFRLVLDHGSTVQLTWSGAPTLQWLYV